MDFDKQMVRGPGEEGWTNLSIGEPFFLQRHLGPVLPHTDRLGESYPEYAGQPQLLALLQMLNPGKHAVVTTGAKQAISAAIYAMARPDVYHAVPHWPSFPTLAKMAGKGWSEDRYHPSSTVIASSPNNPDGRQWLGGETQDILDCAYAHKVYGWNRIIPDHKISVWSASKMFGLSGERIGWALTEDSNLAARMADYVEKTTSGVNIHAQKRLAAILRMNRGCFAGAYLYARDDLISNGMAFNTHITPHCLEVLGVPESGRGMFAWFRVADTDKFKVALERAKILLVSGEACGMTEPGWYRMSMGHYPEVTQEALERLGKELNGH